MWHSVCPAQRDEALLSGQTGEAGSIGAQLLLWPLLGVSPARSCPASLCWMDRRDQEVARVV